MRKQKRDFLLPLSAIQEIRSECGAAVLTRGGTSEVSTAPCAVRFRACQVPLPWWYTSYPFTFQGRLRPHLLQGTFLWVQPSWTSGLLTLVSSQFRFRTTGHEETSYKPSTIALNLYFLWKYDLIFHAFTCYLASQRDKWGQELCVVITFVSLVPLAHQHLLLGWAESKKRGYTPCDYNVRWYFQDRYFLCTHFIFIPRCCLRASVFFFIL